MALALRMLGRPEDMTTLVDMAVECPATMFAWLLRQTAPTATRPTMAMLRAQAAIAAM